MAETNDCYILRLLLNDRSVFVVWYQGSPDGFLRDDQGQLVASEANHDVEAAALASGFVPVAEEPAVYDFDSIRAWCAAPKAAGVNCVDFLNAWNFFDDLTGLHAKADTPYTRLSRAEADCYDKLFCGNNLPAFTPVGERYVPTWKRSELASIRRVMSTGLELLKAQLAKALGDA